MRANPAPATEQSLDFALLHQSVARPAARNRVALLWMLGLLGLLVALVVTLVLYLSNFESDEAARRRATDAQWLEQSVQFQFRRLEDDLLVLSRRAVQPGDGALPSVHNFSGGQLWRTPGVLLWSGWVDATHSHASSSGVSSRWQQDWNANAENAVALSVMQSTTQGLRRAAYAGPMLRADGSASDVVWLAVPFFERGQFSGNYLAAVSIERAMAALVPVWFAQDHRVRLLGNQALAPGADADSYRVALNLPGTELYLQVTQTHAQPATVPRLFLLLALLFLLGMLVALYALRRDFVKRQQIQALLQAQVALRTAMAKSVTIGLRAWDLQGRILYVNEAFARMVGYRIDELIGLSMPFPYWPKEQAQQLRQVHEHIIARGTSGEGVEVQFAHRSGELIDVLIHEAPLTTAAGAQIGWISSVLDISERKRAQRMAAQQQERLEASGRLVAIGEVASTLAHELNQPLGALSSFANGLLNRLHSQNITLQELLPVVERMARLAERAGGIIQRVNAFARRREVSTQRLDLTALLQRVLAGDATTPTPQWRGPGQPVWVEADELLLEHLVNNLLGNAKYWARQRLAGADDPCVRVELRQDAAQGQAQLVVADNGPGVPEDARDSIFNAFVSRKEDGMGMGLAICRSIVEAHHGRIDVGRDAALGGASFTVVLPLAGAGPVMAKEAG